MKPERLTIVYLARHGESTGNVQNIQSGRYDAPLTLTGREQALHLRRKLEGVTFTGSYASYLKRAQETAQIVCPDLPVTVVDGLEERHYGSEVEDSLMTRAELKAKTLKNLEIVRAKINVLSS